MTGIALAASTPLACAVFPQNAAISVDDLEPGLQSVCALEYYVTKF